MKKVFLALFLALSMVSVAALADDWTPGGPALTPAQRQELSTTLRSFGQREEQLNKQFRSQILSAISPDHLKAVADLVGQMAVSSNPDPRAAAQQIDSLLSQSEQQAILSAHNTFREQSKALHEQLRRQLVSERIPGASSHNNGPMQMRRPSEQPDAGTVVLHTLGHFGMEMGHHGWGGPPPPHR
jgi:hypothetical protein